MVSARHSQQDAGLSQIPGSTPQKVSAVAVRPDRHLLSPILTLALLLMSPMPLSRDSHSPTRSVSSEDTDIWQLIQADIQHMLGQWRGALREGIEDLRSNAQAAEL